MDFLETDEFYEVKAGTYSQINEYMTVMNTQYQGHSLTFSQGHSASTVSNFFSSETARPIEARFHMEPSWDVGNENVFKATMSHDHAHIW